MLGTNFTRFQLFLNGNKNTYPKLFQRMCLRPRVRRPSGMKKKVCSWELIYLTRGSECSV